MEKYVEIGYTRKTHGVIGELKFFVEDPYWEVFDQVGRVFLEIRSAKVPFFVQSIRGAHEDILHFEDVPNREAAIPLQSKTMYMLESDLPKDLDTRELSPEYVRLEGYSMTDVQLGTIGIVKSVIEMPAHEVALVDYQGKEIMIPLNEHFIKKIDDKKSEIKVDLPEGMLSL